MAFLNLKKGDAYMLKQWYETALSFYMEALSYYERTNDTDKLIKVYAQISQLYKSLTLIEKSIEYGKKTVELKKDDPYANIYLGQAYSQNKESEKAKSYFLDALRICEIQNSRYMMTYIYFLLSDSFLEVDNLEETLADAEMYLDKMRETSGDNYFQDFYFLSRAQLESIKGNFSQAEKSALKTLEIADQKGAVDTQKLCYRLLGELSLAQHKYREYLNYRDKFETSEIAVAKETAVRSSEEMAAKYETEKKELLIGQQ